MNALYPQAVGIEPTRNFTYEIAACADNVALDVAVPTCDGWDLADLVWHLTEVQTFWVFILANRPEFPDYSVPDRPDSTQLTSTLRSTCDKLVAELHGADPAEQAWSWSDDHTVGFTLRRQTHEAFVHLADALIAADGAAAVQALASGTDPHVGADGVDELIRVILTGVPDWAEHTPSDEVAQVRATDTGDTWTLAFGEVSGTNPDSGDRLEGIALELVEGGHPDTVMSATACELDLWLWGRAPDTVLDVQGNPELAAKLRQVVVETTQ